MAVALALLLVFFAAPGTGFSAATSACDPKYDLALKARADIEAKRESEQNRNLIYKPDSVLEYSCFFSFIEHIKQNSFMPVSDAAWDHLNTTPAFNFLANSFGHVYLGGHFNSTPPWVPGGDYECDAMARMWEFARCINQFQFPDSEGFFGFQWYEGNDPRKYPPEYQACTSAITNVEEAQAANGNAYQWILNPDPAQTDGTYYGTDRVVTYLDKIRWDAGTPPNANANQCGDAIPTGLHIYRRDLDYDDYVCAKPGCTYEPGVKKCMP